MSIIMAGSNGAPGSSGEAVSMALDVLGTSLNEFGFGYLQQYFLKAAMLWHRFFWEQHEAAGFCDDG